MKMLILTARFGMGHYSASSSLAQEIKRNMPNAEIVIQDFFEYALRGGAHFIYDTFNLVANRGWGLFNFFYKYTNSPFRGDISAFYEHFNAKMALLVEETSPDIVISNHPFCSQIFSIYKEWQGSALPLITCLTDISCHFEWINPQTDFYLVPDKVVKEYLITHKVEEKKIMVYGVPVKEQFKNGRSPQKKAQLNLLIMGGGLGIIPVKDQFWQELNNYKQIKTIVITGHNRRLYHKLKARYENIEAVGYTDKVSEYMSNADIILSKPGGITIFEAIFAQLPILAFPPFLCQEVDNGKFICEKGIGKVLPKNNKLWMGQILDLLADPKELEKMRQRMQELKEGLQKEDLAKLFFALDNFDIGA